MLYFFPERTILFQFGELSVRWYGVLYLLAFGLAWWSLPRLQHWRSLYLSRSQWLEIVTWGSLGVITGGRLGYILFYEPKFYLAHPEQVIALWHGGMSAHGGFIGAAIAVWLLSRKLSVDLWQLLDVVVIPVALGLALGRVGNFINQELYISPAAHFISIFTDLLIAAFLYWHLRNYPQAKPGKNTALFLILYAVLRLATEYIRWQEFTGWFGLTRGQILTLPVLVVGVILWIWQSHAREHVS